MMAQSTQLGQTEEGTTCCNQNVGGNDPIVFCNVLLHINVSLATTEVSSTISPSIHLFLSDYIPS